MRWMNRKIKNVLVGYAAVLVLLCLLVPTKQVPRGTSGDYDLIWDISGGSEFDMGRWFVGMVAATAAAGIATGLVWTRSAPSDGSESSEEEEDSPPGVG